jgi:hypothetical protein
MHFVTRRQSNLPSEKTIEVCLVSDQARLSQGTQKEVNNIQKSRQNLPLAFGDSTRRLRVTSGNTSFSFRKNLSLIRTSPPTSQPILLLTTHLQPKSKHRPTPTSLVKDTIRDQSPPPEIPVQQRILIAIKGISCT